MSARSLPERPGPPKPQEATGRADAHVPEVAPSVIPGHNAPAQREEDGMKAGHHPGSAGERAEEPAGRAHGPGLTPVRAAERIHEIDVLRGFALLGILVINIVGFGLPMAAIENPLMAGTRGPADMLVWRLGHVLFYEKFMAIFSMLFGAGLMLMAARAREGATDEGEFRSVYLRRSLWLMVIGLVHAYLIWYGDILFTYGVCGLLVFPMRRRRPRTLILAGIAALLLGGIMLGGIGAQFAFIRDRHADSGRILAEGGALTPFQQRMHEAWEGICSGMSPNEEEVAAEISSFRGGFTSVFRARAGQSFMMQTGVLIMFGIWRVGGLMLLGMGLLRLGVLGGARSTRFYTWMAVAGYAMGLPLAEIGARKMLANGFDLVHVFREGALYNYFGSVAASLGHVGLVMLAARMRVLQRFCARLAAVGRMALSNYLLHSVVFTTLFYGYGFGLFGSLSRAGLTGLVPLMWALQLAASPAWLRRYRHGPAEWLWRGLTYGVRPRMRCS